MNIDACNHSRTIVHFDLDAFYVACERELNPVLLNQAVAVSQYNPHGNLQETHSNDVDKRLLVAPHQRVANNDDSNGSMIAVSYEARRQGVRRGDRGIDALKKCPELYIVQVPVKRGKADLSMYRRASNRIMETLIHSILNFPDLNLQRNEFKVEKASIDEIYVDLTVPVNNMTERILSIRDLDRNGSRTLESNIQPSLELWEHVIRCGKELGSTSIGGIEIMTENARAASQLSKDEVRRGSKFQTFESSLDPGSQTWWDRPLPQWTETELHLACGSALAATARNAVQTKFRKDNCDVFTLSAGISSNKTLAKLASGLKKPNQQTIINPADEGALRSLFHPMPVSRLRGLGGKLGEAVMTKLNVVTVGDLAKVPLTILESEYPRSSEEDKSIAHHLYEISRGVCMEEVSERTIEKSMSSGKTFRGVLALSVSDESTVQNWISELLESLIERLDDDYDTNRRMPGTLSLSMKMKGSQSHASKSCKAPSSLTYDAYFPLTWKLYKQYGWKPSEKILGITITAYNFNHIFDGKGSILSAFERSSQRLSAGSSPKGKDAKGCIHDLDIMDPNLDDAEIDSTRTDTNVNSSLTAQVRTESQTASRTAKMGITSSKRKRTTACIEHWFKPKDASRHDETSPKKVPSSVNKKNSQQEPANHGATVVHKPTNTMRYEDIDQNVLAELPFHIQAMIRREMRQLKPKR